MGEPGHGQTAAANKAIGRGSGPAGFRRKPPDAKTYGYANAGGTAAAKRKLMRLGPFHLERGAIGRKRGFDHSIDQPLNADPAYRIVCFPKRQIIGRAGSARGARFVDTLADHCRP